MKQITTTFSNDDYSRTFFVDGERVSNGGMYGRDETAAMTTAFHAAGAPEKAVERLLDVFAYTHRASVHEASDAGLEYRLAVRPLTVARDLRKELEAEFDVDMTPAFNFINSLNLVQI